MRQKLLSAFLLASLAPLLFTGMQQAAAATSIGISPAYPRKDNERTSNIFVLTIKPGENVKDGVRVFNYSKERKTVQLRAVDSIQSTSGAFSCRQDAEDRKDVGAWTKLDVPKVTLEPESNKVVDFTITVPAGAAPGEHGGCITAQDDDSFAAKSGAGIQLGFRSAIRMAITVPGKIVKELSLQRVEVKRTASGDYTVSPIAKNTGNVSLDLKTRAQVVSVFGQESPVQLAEYPIMRDTTTGWAFTFKRPYWGGFYRARTSISYNADPTAGLGEHVNDTKKVRKDTGYFVMWPAIPAAMVEIAVPIFIIFLAIVLFLRKRRKRHVRTKWQQYTVKQGDSVTSLAIERKTKWKKIAKTNSLKAPYLLQPGQQILLPPLPKQSADWLVEETPAHTQLTEAVEAPAEKSAAPKSPEPMRSPVQAAPAASTWASPRDDTHDSSAYDEYGEPIPDWREGADETEIEKIEHIDGASFAAQYRADWDDAEEKPTKKKPAKRTIAKKKTSVKKSTQATPKKKTPKKAP